MLKISASPHIRHQDSTASIMRDVCIALIPAILAAAVLFGAKAIAIISITVGSCVFFEWLSRIIMCRESTISDYSAVATGILLAFNLPPNIPLWMPIVGSFFAIVVCKQAFGGIGQNFINPALGARIIMAISFPADMNWFAYKLEHGGQAFLNSSDLVSRATPMAEKAAEAISSATKATNAVSSATQAVSFEPYTYWDLFLGLKPGVIGEVCILALLIGAVYLLVRKVIDLYIPLSFIATTLIFVTLAGQDPLHHLLSGGLILGAFFMATDYVTNPETISGHIIFGIGCGLLTGLMRVYGASAEGVSYAIVLMNVLTPHIDRLTVYLPLKNKAHNHMA